MVFTGTLVSNGPTVIQPHEGGVYAAAEVFGPGALFAPTTTRVGGVDVYTFVADSTSMQIFYGTSKESVLSKIRVTEEGSILQSRTLGCSLSNT